MSDQLVGGVVIRGRALAGPLDEAGWKRLLAADTLVENNILGRIKKMIKK